MTRDEINTAENTIAALYADMMDRSPAEVAALAQEIEIIVDPLDALPPGYFETLPTSQEPSLVSRPVSRNAPSAG